MNKTLKVMTSAALLAGVVAPVAVTTVDAAVEKSGSVATVKEDTKVNLGSVLVKIPAGSLDGANDSLIVTLPSKFEFLDGTGTTMDQTDWDTFAQAGGIDQYGQTTGVSLRVPQYIQGSTTVLNPLYAVDADAPGAPDGIQADEQKLKVTKLSNSEIKIETQGAVSNLSNEAFFYINLGEVNVKAGAAAGENKITLTSPSGSGFPAGTVTIANVSGDGQVNLTTKNTQTGNNTFTFDLRLEETLAGSLKQKNETLKLKLPAGFKWTSDLDNLTTGTTPKLVTIFGQKAAIDVNPDDRELTIDFNGVDTDLDGDADFTVDTDNDTVADAVGKTTQASYWTIEGLAYSVDDESKVEAGDIKVSVFGSTQVNATELTVGTYGDFSATVSSKGDAKLIAGKTDQKISDVVVKEGLLASLLNNRTVTFTLPEGVKWDYGTNYSNATGAIDTDSDNNVGLGTGTAPSISNGNKTLKYTVNGTSTDEAEIKLEELRVAISPEFEGSEIKVKVEGTAGVQGEIVVASVTKPVDVKVSEVKDIVIGAPAQQLGDIEITELVKAAFEDVADAGAVVNNVTLRLPSGIEWDGLPTVKVTEGDLEIEDVTKSGRDITFNIDAESDIASKIVISGAKVKVDRTVPEGDVKLAVLGGDILETANSTYWLNADKAASATVAKVVTPAAGSATASEVKFTIGATSYTVDGVEKTMDVAPFVEGSRTYMPIRYVGEAVGADIYWDQATQTATLMKGDRVVQLTAGSKSLKVNGASITMDAAAQVKEGRTVLPVRFVSQALGAQVDYDQTAQTVTVK